MRTSNRDNTRNREQDVVSPVRGIVERTTIELSHEDMAWLSELGRLCGGKGTKRQALEHALRWMRAVVEARRRGLVLRVLDPVTREPVDFSFASIPPVLQTRESALLSLEVPPLVVARLIAAARRAAEPELDSIVFEIGQAVFDTTGASTVSELHLAHLAFVAATTEDAEMRAAARDFFAAHCFKAESFEDLAQRAATTPLALDRTRVEHRFLQRELDQARAV